MASTDISPVGAFLDEAERAVQASGVSRDKCHSYPTAIHAKVVTVLPSRLEPLPRMRYLDLGCGVYSPRWGSQEAWRTPENCDQVADAGWEVTGVDQWPLGLDEQRSKEKGWKYVRGDLTDRHFWRRLPSNHWDVVQSNQLISVGSRSDVSPSLCLSGTHDLPHYYPTLEGQPEYLEFLGFFFTEVTRVLRVGGVFFLNICHIMVKEEEGLRKRVGMEGPHILTLPSGILQV